MILRKSRDRERGAALVEFAILAPLLILLLTGIIEFAWVFGQNLSVRHGAREAARIAAVNFGTTDSIGTEVCNRTDLLSSITLTLSGDPSIVSPAGTYDPGDEVTAQVQAAPTFLTGFYDGLFPSLLSATVTIRVEQDTPSWTATTVTKSC